MPCLDTCDDVGQTTALLLSTVARAVLSKDPATSRDTITIAPACCVVLLLLVGLEVTHSLHAWLARSRWMPRHYELNEHNEHTGSEER